MRRVPRPDSRAVSTMGSRFPDEKARQKYAAQAQCWTEEKLANAVPRSRIRQPLDQLPHWEGRSAQAGLVNWASKTTAGTDGYRLDGHKPAQGEGQQPTDRRGHDDPPGPRAGVGHHAHLIGGYRGDTCACPPHSAPP